jgi:hemoglobin
MQNEILNLEDIKLLVNTFYNKVRNDDLLASVFNDKIKDRWPAHLEKMYRFWQTLLLDQHTYSGAPFPPHAKLPVGREHFDRWIEIFYETVDENFVGKKGDEAKWRAQKMAEIFYHKIEYFKNNPEKLLL